MLNHIKLTLSTLIFAALCASHANAGLITYNLAGNSGDGAEGALLDGLSDGTVTKGGVTARLSTGLPELGINPALQLNQTGSQFGINLDLDGCDVSGEIDLDCGVEVIIFEFNRFVKLVSLTLTSYGPNDDANLAFENIVTAASYNSGDLPSSPSTLLIGAPVGGLGDRFSLQARAGNGFSLDRFTIEVPEPGTVALFGLGLAGLGFVRRKKS